MHLVLSEGSEAGMWPERSEQGESGSRDPGSSAGLGSPGRELQFILMAIGSYQRVFSMTVMRSSFKVSLASLVVGKKADWEKGQVATAVIQARDEGGWDPGGSSHGGETFDPVSTWQRGLTRLADGLDGVVGSSTG